MTELELDDFQVRACQAIDAGRSVLVAAPTGAGKTVVGEHACQRALSMGRRCFYTTPIKALSNQKYRDFAERFGEENVGLLTGDRSIHGTAPIVVMTTEVLRNMLYEQSNLLRDLDAVVLDEVHYLADQSRGVIWEEVLIQLAESVAVVALSATVSNAEEFGAWLGEVRADCEIVIEETRPVPLRHHYFVNGRVYPTFKAGQNASQSRREKAAEALAGMPNPQVLALEHRARATRRVNKRGRRVPAVRLKAPRRWQVAKELEEKGWLPAIYFVFSRQGCDKAAQQLVADVPRMTNARERDQIESIIEDAVSGIADRDLSTLGLDSFRNTLLHGVAAHHAGLVPAFKEAVEVAFQRGLIKIVVATETLALGINMPAKAVVIEQLEKWNGEQHALLTPGQYTQLTGRAGRRGIDRVGHAVILHQRMINFRTTSSLVGTRTYPLHSSFRPSYNMAVNLLRGHDRATSEELIRASFAQFQADHGGKSVSLADMFDRIVNILCDLGYLSADDEVTADGLILARIHSEADLLIAECLRDGLLDDLDEAELAAAAALFVFEPGGDEPTRSGFEPTHALREFVEDGLGRAEVQRARESVARLPLLRDVDPGFVGPAWRWATGAPLEHAIGATDMTGGDFVRNAKQVADLLVQLSRTGGVPNASAAVKLVRRGVVDQ